jgi:ribosomal-protein-alanine N-acetyltransferase
MLSPLSHFDCAFLDGVLVGYAGFWLVLDEAHITSVTVRRDCRRQGLGRQLLTHLLDVAQNLDVRRATLEVRVSNVAAQRLYEGFGFEIIGRRKGYYAKTQEDALVMLKELGPPPSAADLYGED